MADTQSTEGGRILTSKERIEDMVFENRIKELTEMRRWEELNLVQLVYASIYTDRENARVLAQARR